MKYKRNTGEGEERNEGTARLARTLDRLIAALMLAILVTVAWPLGLVFRTAARPPTPTAVRIAQK